jgi:hypothetical protein
MRTTVTLDPELVAKLKGLAHRRRASFKDTLNAVIRRGLATQGGSGEAPARFVVKPHAGGFRRGVDPDKLNQLIDEIEADEFAQTSRSGR